MGGFILDDAEIPLWIEDPLQVHRRRPVGYFPPREDRDRPQWKREQRLPSSAETRTHIDYLCACCTYCCRNPDRSRPYALGAQARTGR